MKELEFKIENIGNETIIYYVDTMEIKSNHLVICNKISENIYNNIRYIEYHNDIYKSRCDFHLRLELTLEEIKNHIITQCVCLITKNYLEDNAGYKERHYISLNKLNSLINFLNKTPTEKEIIYILHDEYNTINGDINKLISLPRWKMHLALFCNSPFFSDEELIKSKYFYTTRGKNEKYDVESIRHGISEKLRNRISDMGQLDYTYQKHIEKLDVIEGRTDIADYMRGYVLHSLYSYSDESIKYFCNIQIDDYNRWVRDNPNKKLSKLSSLCKEFVCDFDRVKKLVEESKNARHI